MPEFKIGRNAPCPCGSGKKFKQCCQQRQIDSASTERLTSQLLQTGIAHHQAGRWQEAEAAYQEILRTAPGHAEALQYSGLIDFERGNTESALGKITSALSINPNDAFGHCNLGNALLSARRHQDALNSYDHAVRLKPDFVEAWFNRGNVLLDLGRNEEALESNDKALQIHPNFAEAHINRGKALLELKRYNEALASNERARQLKPGDALIHNNLGLALQGLQRLEEAAACYREALRLRPDYANPHSNLGSLFQEQERFSAAMEHFRNAIALRPDFAEAHGNLGSTLRHAGQFDEAEASCRYALRLKPTLIKAHNTLGVILQDQGKLDAAIDSYGNTLALDPDYAEGHKNMGIALMEQGKFDDSLQSYRRALALDANDNDVRFSVGLLDFLKGDLAQGWKNYEYRWSKKTLRVPKRSFALPWWQGESLENKAILIWGEQGIGDEIMFASLYPDILAQARRCVIACSAKLVPLFARSFPAAEVITLPETEDAVRSYAMDYQCAAGSLGQWLRHDLAKFENHDSFLKPDQQRVTYWKMRLGALGGGLKIGICWRSSDKSGNRHLHYTTLDQWGPIFSVPETHFINLQYDECRAELTAASDQFHVKLHDFNEVDLYNDLDEAAALTAALDLVITAPTAAGMLAAAVGVPTWEMRYGKDWSSFGTSRNPWFPPLRFFSRAWNQEWKEVIDQVAAHLAIEAAEACNRTGHIDSPASVNS